MNLTAARVREVLDYDPCTGVFVWKTRVGSGRGIANWNPKYAGKPAGRVDNYGYVQIGIGGRLYRAHRLAWLHVHGDFPNLHVDHIDRNRSNNAIANLRLATHGQNHANRAGGKNSVSGIKGVTPLRQKWRAVITVDGRKRSLGTFATKEGASAAYADAARRLRGEFAFV